MGLFNSLFGNAKGSSKIEDLLDKGAIILDVRTRAEFKGGHINDSKNVPLQELNSQLAKIKNWGKPLVICCASGGRSAQATRSLQREGLECINGGGWRSLQQRVL